MASFHSRLTGFAAVAVVATIMGMAPAFAYDPPSIVGRISTIDGVVSSYSTDTNTWSDASINYPVVQGNSFWTDENGRDEIQIGAVDLRMDNLTEVTLAELDSATTRINMPQGVVNLRIRAIPAGGSVQIVTPLGPITFVEPGSYHIDVSPPSEQQPATQVFATVFEGRLRVRGQRSMLDVMPGEMAAISNNPPSFALQEANRTAFDDWSADLERRDLAAQTPGYVSPYMTGVQDLGQYGQWQTEPQYGAVWYPSVQQNWAPYQYGRWAFVQPWGWTWVDNAPWGWAPFHYGRWAQFHNRWGWVPGSYIEHPVYAPALVAFNADIVIGGRRQPPSHWVPLGPHEEFHPYYRTSDNYVRNVNRTHEEHQLNVQPMNRRGAALLNSGPVTQTYVHPENARHEQPRVNDVVMPTVPAAQPVQHEYQREQNHGERRNWQQRSERPASTPTPAPTPQPVQKLTPVEQYRQESAQQSAPASQPATGQQLTPVQQYRQERMQQTAPAQRHEQHQQREHHENQQHDRGGSEHDRDH